MIYASSEMLNLCQGTRPPSVMQLYCTSPECVMSEDMRESLWDPLHPEKFRKCLRAV